MPETFTPYPFSQALYVLEKRASYLYALLGHLLLLLILVTFNFRDPLPISATSGAHGGMRITFLDIPNSAAVKPTLQTAPSAIPASTNTPTRIVTKSAESLITYQAMPSAPNATNGQRFNAPSESNDAMAGRGGGKTCLPGYYYALQSGACLSFERGAGGYIP